MSFVRSQEFSSFDAIIDSTFLKLFFLIIPYYTTRNDSVNWSILSWSYPALGPHSRSADLLKVFRGVLPPLDESSSSSSSFPTSCLLDFFPTSAGTQSQVKMPAGRPTHSHAPKAHVEVVSAAGSLQCQHANPRSFSSKMMQRQKAQPPWKLRSGAGFFCLMLAHSCQNGPYSWECAEREWIFLASSTELLCKPIHANINIWIC